MTTATVKDMALDAIQQLPDDTTIDEMMERLYFLGRLEQGIREADAGDLIPHEEIEREFLR